MIILFLHWGTEYDTIPAKSQTDLAEYFFSIGVDLIIGSHPHVLQKMIWSKNAATGKDGIVVYSLGNFVSNQRKPKTDGGSMVRIELTRNGRFIQYFRCRILPHLGIYSYRKIQEKVFYTAML